MKPTFFSGMHENRELKQCVPFSV